MKSSLIRFLAIAATCASAAGISRRHDVPDVKYRELAEKYPEVGRFAFGSKEDFGSSVLIGPRWIVLASHNLMFASGAFSVDFNGKTYPIDWCQRHLAGLPAPNNADFTRDIAVCHLTLPVKGIRPAQLYTGRSEEGKEVVVVGFGIAGDGLTGADAAGGSGTKRAAQNRIDGVGTLEKVVSEDPEGKLLFYDFDAPPGGASKKYWLGKPGEALPLEGMMTAGDSGGGVFIEEAGSRKLIGLNSGCFGDNGRPAGTSGKGHFYGIGSRTVRISSFIEWIRKTIARFESGKEPLAGIAAHWSFDESSGVFAEDMSGVGHRGTVTGAKRVAGIKGGALAFEADGRVEVPNETGLFRKAGREIANDLKLRNDATIAAWINMGSPVEQAVIVSKGDWSFGIHAGTLRFYRGEREFVTSKAAAGLAPKGTWQHIAVTRTGEVVQFYLDGKPAGTVPLAGQFALTDTPVRLALPAGSLLDEVRIYRRGLAGDEVRKLVRVDSSR